MKPTRIIPFQRGFWMLAIALFFVFVSCNNKSDKKATTQDTTGNLVDTTRKPTDTDIIKTDTAGKMRKTVNIPQYKLSHDDQVKLFSNGVKQINFLFVTTKDGLQLQAWGTKGTEENHTTPTAYVTLTPVPGPGRDIDAAILMQVLTRGDFKQLHGAPGRGQNSSIADRFFRDVWVRPFVYNDTLYFSVSNNQQTPVPTDLKRIETTVDSKPSPPARPCDEYGTCDGDGVMDKRMH
jgi:hypothetical protein